MSDDCLRQFDDWIVSKKNAIYEKNVKSIDNSATVLKDYEDNLKTFANRVIDAIDSEEPDELRELEVPEPLIKCVNISMNNIDFKDRVIHWCITFPNTNHPKLLEQQIKETSQ
jgi:hypothetical protein